MSSTSPEVISRARVLLRPLDTSTAEGRSRRRYRRIAMNVATSLLGRGISIPVNLITVPLTVNYLGTERFGMWMTISSAVAMLGFLDLGIGQGLLNVVAECDGRQDRARARSYVSSAFLLLCFVAVAVVLAFAASHPFVSWGVLFNVRSALASSEAGATMSVLVACFAASLPLSVVRQVQLGHQEGFANDLWQSVGQLLGLGALLIAIWLRAGLPWLVLCLVGAPHVAALGNWTTQFGFRRRWLLPAWSAASLPLARDLMGKGLYFSGVAVCGALAVSADNLIIAHALGPDAVAQYTVPARLFLVGSTLLTALLYPLWPAYTEAFARLDYAWIRATFRRTIYWGLVVAGGPCVLLVLFGRPLIHHWVGSQITPGLPLLCGLALRTVAGQLGQSVYTLLVALNLLPFRLVLAAVLSVAAFGLKLLWVGWFGLPGVAWAMFFSSAVLGLAPALIFVNRFFDHVEAGRLPDRGTLWLRKR